MVLPVGAHPWNTGGEKGRSGRRTDEFKAKLEAIRDESALPFLERVLAGKVKAPVDSRLRCVDLALKYTAAQEKIVRLEGPEGIQAAFDAIKATVRRQLAPDAAEALLHAMNADLGRL